MASPSDCSMGARIGFAILGIVIGVCVSLVFGIEYQNLNASLWGLVSGLVAALTLFVHVSFVKKWYHEDPHRFRCYMYCGCFAQLLGLCGFVAYIVLAIHEGQGIVIYGPGYYIASVWCFMTLKWGFQLFFFSRSYWRHLTADYKLLPPPEYSTVAAPPDYGSKI